MEAKHVVIAAAVGGLWLAAAGLLWLKNRSTEQAVEASRERPPPDGIPVPTPRPATPPPRTTPRLLSVEHARPGEEGRALETIRAILAAPEHEDEARRARELLPQRYRDAFVRAHIEHDFPRLEALVQQAAADCPGTPQLAEMVQHWRSARAEWTSQAIESGDEATAARLFELALQDGGPLPHRTAEYVAGRWKAARARGDEAGADDAVRLQGRLSLEQGMGSGLAGLLGEAFGREGCLARGDAFRDAGDAGAAVVCYEAARFMTGRDAQGATVIDERYAVERAEVDERIRPVLLDVARRAVRGESSVGLERAESIAAELGRDASDDLSKRLPEDVLRLHRECLVECWRLQIASRTERARRRLEAGDFAEADRLCDFVLETDALFFFDALARDPTWDPWVHIPPALAARADTAASGAGDEARRAALRREMDRSPLRPALPETEPARRLRGAIDAGWGVAGLARDRDHSLERLRRVLREHAGTEHSAVAAEGLRGAIRAARTAGDFSGLVDLAGFYVAEVGPPGSTDAFRGELRETLERAADHFGSREPLARVFLLSLLADLFAGEPAGDAHRREVFRLGFEFVERTGGEPIAEDGLPLPSGLGGLSVVTVENGTRFHVLAFFRGPVEFFVRLNPYRRGSIVLPDGAWTSAVLVTSHDVKPWRGTTELRSVVRAHSYYIGREGEDDAPRDVQSIGDFLLLWRPEGAGEFHVDPASGFVRR